MKRLLFIVFLFANAQLLLAQSATTSSDFVNQSSLNPEDSPFEPNVLLIKFRDGISPKLIGTTFNYGSLDALLLGEGVTNVKRLFPYLKPYPNGISSVRLHTGQELKLPNLENIFRIEFHQDSLVDIGNLIARIQNDCSGFIEYSEPNYYVFSTDYTPNDGLYNNQWNKEKIKADTIQIRFNADPLMSDTNIVVAILDTGIDTLHPDLKNKLYFNKLEKNGIPGYDDDQNGYVDDIFGWDVINNDGIAFDDNSHGTHCAGIVGAEGNNGIGVVGISEGARLMPVKILQSNGYGGNDDIAEGLVYAANNGAQVISMSFGSYGRSNVQENALAYAYAFSFLVAAAGNDGKCIGPGIMCKPAFPASYSFVLGVQATKPYQDFTGWLAQWSNFDQDGPLYSGYEDYLNYEVQAPGAGIISTIPLGNFTSSAPQGRYAYYSGTSMATPAVAGAVALMKAYNPNWTNDEIFIRLIRSWYNPFGYFIKSPQFPYNDVDILEAIDSSPSPFTVAVGLEVVDTLVNCDNDGIADAGEQIILKVRYRNFGSTAQNILAKLSFSEFEDPSVGTWVHQIDTISSIAPYSEAYGHFEFRIDSSVVNNRAISLLSKTIEIGQQDTIYEGLSFNVENGVEILPGYYPGKVIFRPSINYIVKGNIYADTLIIKPGAIVSMNPGVTLSFNYITCVGKQDSIITFTRASIGYWTGFTNMNNDVNYHPTIEYSKIEFFNNNGLILNGYINNGFIFRNCIFENGNGNIAIWGSNDGESVTAEKCVFMNLYPESHGSAIRVMQGSNFLHNVVGGNKMTFTPAPIVYLAYGNSVGNVTPVNFRDNAFVNNKSTGYGIAHIGAMGGAVYKPVSYLRSNYFGYSNLNRINATVIDMVENPNVPAVLIAGDSALSIPSESCHGVVVDVRINGISINRYDNPYDGPNGLGALANGNHSVEVVFNRSMDTLSIPFVSFGGRYPFTTHVISDSANWSSNGKIWEATLSVSTARAVGGINRLSVRNYFDNENFPGPTDDDRFEFRVDNSGAMSNDFVVTPDTGFIRTQWGRPEDLDDFLGYNLYRIDSTNILDTNLAPLQLNSQLMLDSSFLDSNVIGGTYYGYYFQVTRTNLSNTQNSDTLWARPWQGPPVVITQGAANITHNSATLIGLVKPNYLGTTARFSFGLSSSYSTHSTSQYVGSGSLYVTRSMPLTGLTPGTIYHYRIEGTNAEGTSYGHDSTFTTKAFPTLNFRYDSTLCLMDTLKITNNTTISTGSMNYAWEVRRNGSLVYTSSLEEPAFYMNQAGSYTVKLTVSSDQAVTTSKTGILTVDPIPTPTVTASGSVTLCQGGTVTLSAPSGYTYLWSNGATTQTIVVSASGSYSVEVTNVNGCSGTSPVQNVVVNALPTAAITSANSATSFCTGSSLTLSAPTGMTGYQWKLNGTTISGATSASYSAAAAGSYTVLITNASGCTSLSAGFTVTENALPTAAVSALSSTTFCQGDSVVLSAPAGYTYLWSNGATTQSITASTAGTYSVVVTNASGCSVTSSSVTVTVNYIPTMSVTNTGALSFCTGGSTTLTAAGGFASYLWSNGATTQSIIVNAAGTYSVTGYTAAGCTSQSSATSVVVSALPVASVSASGSTTFCLGDSVVLSAPAGYTYLWSTGATTQSITITSSGSYQVTVTNANGCSTTSASTAVQVSTISTPSLSANGATNFCQGGSVVLSAPSGYSYLWSNGSTGSSITVTTAGAYTVTVTNAVGCSATSASVAVTIDPLPSVTATAQGATTFCPGDSVMLMANPGLSNYTWSNGQSGPSIWVYQAGTYTVEAENANGCVGQSNGIQVTVSPVPATPTVYYSNNANLLISSAPTGNQWYLNGVAIPGADSTTWYPTQNGIYSVIVTNAAGCSSESAQFNYVNIGTDEWLRAQIKLYPNPNDGKFQIAYPAEMEFETVRVMDGVGRILYEGKAETNRVELDLSKEASGLYRVELMGAKGFIYLPVTIQR